MVDRLALEQLALRWRSRVTGRSTPLDHWLARRALHRRYHGVALPRPRYAFVDSPIAAALATGIATSVRWLQRHPETHRALFERPLDAAGLAEAVREAAATAVVAVYGRALPRLEAAIGRAVATVTSGAAGPLPARVRAAAAPIETVEAVPRLAVADGWLEDALFTRPLAKLRGEIATRLDDADRAGLPTVNDAIGHALDAALSGLADMVPAPGPAGFLTRCLATWWERRRPFDHRLEDLAVISWFAARRELGLDYREVLDIVRIARRTGAVFVHAEFWIAADRPRAVFDVGARLHRIGGPAVAWCDGTGLWFLHGVAVPEAIACGRFGTADILAQANAEIRRTMIELYDRGDHGRFLRDADADVIHIDLDRLGHQRRLLRVPLFGDEAYVGVEVINSTPEPDGSHRRYILRVPPTITTCRAAVAWTFGLTEAQYDPVAET